MAAVYSPAFLMQFKVPTTTPRTTVGTGSGKASGNRPRTRTGAAVTGAAAVMGAKAAVMGAAAVTGASPSSIASRAPKLRDSCNACAAAKVRCTKQKPTCTRCDKSGLNCEYNATRRAGRPSQASAPSPAKVTKPLQHPGRKHAPSEVYMPSPPASRKRMTSETTSLASPSIIESPSTQQHTALCQDTLPNLLASTDSTTTALPPSLTAFNAEFDDFFTSLGTFPGLETPTYDLLSLPSCVDSVSNTMDTNDTAACLHENLSIADDECSDMQISTDSHALSNSRQSITGYVENAPAFGTDTPCCCLTNALGFLEELLPNASKANTQQGEQQISVSDAEPPFTTIQSVIAQNERIVEAMDSILQCPCSQQDGYLLTVLSLGLFKILDWYTAAGRAAPTVTTTAACYDSYYKLCIFPPHNPCCDIQRSSRSSSSQFVAGSLCVDGEDSGRVAMQMVLSELHRAQSLVNKLSARFKRHGTGRAAEGMEVAPAVSPNSAADGIDMLRDGKATWPFSTSMFDQLEADLRRRLRTVSLVIVDMIRRV